MRSHNRKLALLLVVLLVVSAGWMLAADKNKKKKPGKNAAAAVQMDESKRALHVLNRLAFGPRPGDLARVNAMGVDNWIEQQLHPEKIDDAALQSRLAPFRTLNMSARQTLESFPPPQLVKRIENGRAGLPSDPEKRAVYESAMERYEQRKENKAQGASQGSIKIGGLDDAAPTAAATDDSRMSPAQNDADAAQQQQRQRERHAARLASEDKAEQLAGMAPDQRYQAILRMDAEERRLLITGMPQDQRQRMFMDFTPQQRETLQATINPQGVPVSELQQAKVLRAAYSERQLEEVMTDFWFNHFNVFLNKGADRYLVNEYERDVIRPRALGKFKDLLVATAKSPAMMFYLDNWQSVGPHSQAAENGPRGQNAQFRRFPGGGNRRFNRGFGAGFPQQFPQRFPQQGRPANNDNAQNGNAAAPKPPKKAAGLNENYGRELMELHTLGVDGGYTQKDVTEVAKVFTGWTIRNPRMGGDFDYNGRMHEPGPKHVLGQEIKDDGEAEGMKVLDVLAHHPATAHFICKKLAMRFVSDDPPPALVDRMAETFTNSDGDIREVLRTLFRSPEFWAPEAYRAKVKTPLEFVVSAIRASGADVDNAQAMVQTLNQMGMPLYLMQPPTGYSMKADAWVNSAALLNRMNFALRLASGRLPGAKFDAQQLFGVTDAPPDSERALALLENALLAGDVSKQTHETIRKQIGDPQLLAQSTNGAALPGNTTAQNEAQQPAQPQAMTAPRPAQAGMVAGLILGSPEFQRR